MKELPPLPDLDSSDIPDVRFLSPEDLAKVSFEKVKWECCIKHCHHFTTVKDYGISPFFLWRKTWFDLQTRIFFCGRHWKRYDRGREVPEHYFKPGSGLDHLKRKS